MKFEKLLQKFDARLSEIKNEQPQIINQANFSILACNAILSEMNRLVLKCGFKNESEEIRFFKKTKINPLSKLVYFSEIRSLEVKFPKVSVRCQKKHINTRIKRINRFYNSNIEFIQYVNERNTHLDELYYTRTNNNGINLGNNGSYFRSPEFCTSHDIVLAKLKGYDKLANYLQNRLFGIKNPKALSPLDVHKKSRLRWTSSKVALTELIYALHSSGAINSGAADIKEIASITERIFNVELGDFYRTFLEIRNRKTGRTKFLENLSNSLKKRMDDIDE
ncbi:RteC domain-containing protein [Aureibaculum conchae]|uniref:RteC domain-containing protein n=1 Tax=Aureibaculum sp. 2308TA14-22 TaxID=3108392 RepID=UPI003393F4DC